MSAGALSNLRLESQEWGPFEIASQDLDLLADFTGLSREEAADRLCRYRAQDMAKEWREAGPPSSEEIRAFYSRTTQYLWELLGWHGSASYRHYLGLLDSIRERWPPETHPRALDFGAGVGTAALRLAELGYEVTLAEVPGRTLEFARRRLDSRGIPARVLEVTGDVPSLPRGGWDVVVCFDVLEHVPDAGAVARVLARSLRTGGIAAIEANFTKDDPRWPHHLTVNAERFREHRWRLFLSSVGLTPRGDAIYMKAGGLRTALHRTRYVLWRATGVYIDRLER